MGTGIAAVVEADRKAVDEVDTLRQRLASRVRAERERLDRERAAATAAARAERDAVVVVLERDGTERVEARRAARAEARRRRKERADEATDAAVKTYVAIVMGGGGA